MDQYLMGVLAILAITLYQGWEAVTEPTPPRVAVVILSVIALLLTIRNYYRHRRLLALRYPVQAHFDLIRQNLRNEEVSHKSGQVILSELKYLKSILPEPEAYQIDRLRRHLVATLDSDEPINPITTMTEIDKLETSILIALAYH